MEAYEGKERRESQRVKSSLIVRMRFPRLEDFRYRYTRDISRGGVFIQTTRPKPIGSSVMLLLETGQGEPISLSGEVVTAIDTQEAAARGLQAGMGIRFLDLDGKKRAEIEAVLGEGHAPPPAPPPDPAAEIARLASDAKQLLAGIEAKDFYQLLGVDRSSNTGEIRRGFLKLTRRFHPDNYFRRATPDTTRDLEDIYDHLTRAYETLMNREHRQAYDISIGNLGGNRDGVSAEDMGRAAAEQRRKQVAPAQVKRAEQLLAQANQEAASGQTGKAVANLKLALAFDPENAHIRGRLQELQKKR